jgi:hypothetical protein
VFPKLVEQVVAYANVIEDHDLIDAYSVAVYGKPIFMTPEEYKLSANAQQSLARH